MEESPAIKEKPARRHALPPPIPIAIEDTPIIIEPDNINTHVTKVFDGVKHQWKMSVGSVVSYLLPFLLKTVALAPTMLMSAAVAIL
eukprot:3592658-Karenia_brevis.AAC.1